MNKSNPNPLISSNPQSGIPLNGIKKVNPLNKTIDYYPSNSHLPQYYDQSIIGQPNAYNQQVNYDSNMMQQEQAEEASANPYPVNTLNFHFSNTNMNKNKEYKRIIS